MKSPSSNDSTSNDPVLTFLLTRRSGVELVEPAPSDAQLATMLQAAASAPDHGGMRPYRFVIVRGAGRDRFGDALAAAAAEARPGVPAEAFAKVRNKAFKAPLLVVVIAAQQAGGKAEPWEQSATAACAGFAVVLAANALGVGAVWKSSPFMRGRALVHVLGLGPDESALGWINLGRELAPAEARRAPDVSALATVLDGDARRAWPD